MLHAVTAPLTRTVMLGGLMLALTGAAFVARHDHRTIRLSLDTEWRSDCVYLTAWEDGRDVTVDLPSHKLVPFKFIITGSLTDGCRWRATESLVPLDDQHFSYAYSEEILSCEPDALPAIKTPRTGIATIVE